MILCDASIAAIPFILPFILFHDSFLAPIALEMAMFSCFFKAIRAL